MIDLIQDLCGPWTPVLYIMLFTLLSWVVVQSLAHWFGDSRRGRDHRA